LRPTAGNLKAGEALYAQNCESCHGAAGMGDGPAGKDLDPPPPALAGGRMPMIDDGYRMWAVSEGGAVLKTGMPAFKDTLTVTQRWQVLLYLERGLPTPRWGRGHMQGGRMGRGMGPGMGGRGMGRGMGPGMGGPGMHGGPPDDE
jgi:mono/diheme cytochrome c family protein